MNSLKHLFVLSTMAVLALTAVPTGFVHTPMRLGETNTTATNTTENYYKGVRCDWWCPVPKKGEVKPDPPTEEEGCICEIPDTRPISE